MDEHPKWDDHEDDTSPDATRAHRALTGAPGVTTAPAGVAAQHPTTAEDDIKVIADDDEPGEEERAPLRFPGFGNHPAEQSRPRLSDADRPPLPHWTEPPTGEPPVDERAEAGAGPQDDLEAWSSLATAAPRWRDRPGDWESPDYEDAALLRSESKIGALDDSDRPAPEPVDAPEVAASTGTWSPPPPPAEAEDDDASDAPAPRRRRGPADRPRRRPRAGDPSLGAPPPEADPADGPSVEAARGRNMVTAIAIGIAFVALALVLFSLGPGPSVVLVTAIVVLASAELFGALQRTGYQPATLLGLVASGSLVAAAYWKGETALPLVLGLTVVAALLWYLIGVTRQQPTMNAAVSVLGVAYVGLLGSFGALILGFPNGVGVFIGVVLAVVANDVGALAAGRRFGRSLLAPEISPNKTWEGLLGGAVATVVSSVVVLGFVGVHPWDVGSALALGLVVAVVAPLGDLCESMIKRDLELKDMGSALPGHGGVLDRFDAMLFALPASYYLCRLLEVF